MIRLQQVKLRPDHTEKQLRSLVAKTLRLKDDHFTMHIRRRSLDARKKPDIFYVYTVDVEVAGEEKILKASKKNKQVSAVQPAVYRFPITGHCTEAKARPVIIGSGPAGMFCGLMLARAGMKPILLERGQDVETRKQDVEHFWASGELNPSSNVQFGEGGAGTFSDGKLNTAIKDSSGRIRYVLEEFVKAGANPAILYDYKPHVGTDVLEKVVQHIRREIESLGGEYRFGHQLTDLEQAAKGYILRGSVTSGEQFAMEADTVVLALGHSARDTFAMLHARGFVLQPKSFAMGVRVQHPQAKIDAALYGEDCPYEMPPASYKLTHKLSNGGGVYSFCMCPGGYVVNASSEPGRLAVNGMSYSDRGSENANSAIVVTISAEEFADQGVLGGIALQRQLEEAAYQAGGGDIPVQTLTDFRLNRPSAGAGSIKPMIKGRFAYANVRSILPDTVAVAIDEGMHAFDRQIKGFDDGDALLCGIESRTSSPVRIVRGADFMAEQFPGIYPCGEGAGYAGGITSAAVDGLKVAEAIARQTLRKD